MKSVLIRLTTEQIKAIEEERAKTRPISSVAGVIRTLIDKYLIKK